MRKPLAVIVASLFAANALACVRPVLAPSPTNLPTPSPTVGATATPNPSHSISRTAYENVIRQYNNARAALEELSKLTEESLELDKEYYDKARYEKIIKVIDKAMFELALVDMVMFTGESNEQFPVYTDRGTRVNLYLPADIGERGPEMLKIAKVSYLQKIMAMTWDREYLPPHLEDVLDYLGIKSPYLEAVTEAAKPENNVPARAVNGEQMPFTKAQLILDTAGFLPYLNQPIPTKLSPEPVPLKSFSLAPFPVDLACLEHAVAGYNKGVGIAPRLEGDKLVGFVYWPQISGAGYTGMDADIRNIGRRCQMPFPGPTEPVQTFSIRLPDKDN